jgi:hypothetical protein
MSKRLLGLTAATLLLVATAAARDRSSSKPVTLSGKVSDDCKTLVAQNNENWSITNPDAVAGREGRQVKIKCRVSAGRHEIQVLSVKPAVAQTAYFANKGDSAFRR